MSAEQQSQQAQQPAVQQPSLRHDALVLALKAGVVVAALVVMFTVVFGIYRVSDDSMSPLITDGDLVLYYRLDRSFAPRQVVAFTANGNVVGARVVAMPGDEVDIDDKGLKINGSYQQEMGITEETTQVADGVTFPLDVPQGSVFLLGDNRGEAIDSRIVGCVPVDQLEGRVVAQLRRRGF